MAELALDVPMDLEGFLAWENQQEERYELVGGVVRMMAGGKANHDLVQMNAGRALGNRLDGSGCRVHGTNLKVRSPGGDVMYPDIYVRCNPHVGDVTSFDDPVIVVEVLSPSTQHYDLTLKRWAYQTIPSVKAILFINPDKPWIEQFSREADGSWRSRTFQDLTSSLPLAALGIELPLAEVYRDADLAAGVATASGD